MENKLKPVVQAATFTIFSAENNKPVSKRLSLLPDFTLNKQSLAYNLARAIAETVTATPTQFAAGLQGLNKSQALAYGVMKHGRESAHIVTKRDTATGFCFPEDINRSGEDFAYGVKLQGILMCDGDDPNFPLEMLQQILTQMDSAFATAPAVTRPSTSSCIYNSVTGDEVRGVTGFRLYLFIDDANLIPDLVKWLKAHFWLGGHGSFKISSSGSLLERFPIDFAVYQPNHLDYCSGAVCDHPLVQRLPAPVVINPDAPFLDMAALIARLQLTDEAMTQANTNKLAAREEKTAEAFEVREQWIATRVQQLVTTRKVSKEAAESVVRAAVETDELGGDFELTMQNGELITVAELLSNPKKYNGTSCCDPLEPAYHRDTRIAYISIKLGQQPYIFSHAHGGKRYKLSRTRNTIIVQSGDTVLAVDETVAVLKSHPQVFDRGDQMVHVSIDDKANITTTVLEGHAIADFLGREIRYKKIQVVKGKTTLVNIDPPLKICQHLESRGKQRQLKPLCGTTNVPFLRADGSVCDSVGYDEASGILFTTADGVDTYVNPTPTLAEVMAAVELLWKPFELFPFDNEVSRSTFFCALLTTALRKVLDTAPGIAIDAADAGSGKSLLAICLGILVSGKIPTFVTCPENDEEMRKKLTSLLLSGSEIIVFDNVGFKLKSQSLEAFLTARFFGDRLLGGNKMTSLLNNALFVANGNNFTIVGDLNRRLLKCRLDANMQAPHLRSFDLDPIQFVRENRLLMIKAALMIVCGALTLGANVKPKGSMASFEQWDGLVRKSVCWLATLPEMPIKLVDPVQAISANYAYDPLTVQVEQLFVAWHALFGSTVLTSKLLIHELELRLQNPLLAIEAQALKDAFDDALSNKPFAAKDIGDYLAKIKDKVSKGLKLVRLDKPSGGYAQWQLTTL